MNDFYYTFFFSIYPYICLSIFVIGTIVRYDKEQYSWRASSSQLLADKGLKVGNILFHLGIIFIFFWAFCRITNPSCVLRKIYNGRAKANGGNYCWRYCW